MKVKDLFTVKYGVNLELMTLETVPDNDADGVNFVARTAINNGVVARVRKIYGIEPQPAGILSCAGGGSVLSTFVQTQPFYSGRDLYTLTPKKEMPLHEKLYWCMCIRANAYKYTYGRQANKTLKDIELPYSVPEWVYSTHIEPIKTAVKPVGVALRSVEQWGTFLIGTGNDKLFTCSTTKSMIETEKGKYPYVTRSALNNGVSDYVSNADYVLNKGNCITIGAEGKVAFYQDKDFIAGVKVYTLRHKSLNQYNAAFICTLLNRQLYKYSYGRARILSKIKEEIIKLPITADGSPDWNYMEQYIKSLPYSDRI